VRVQFPPEDSAEGVMTPIGVRRFTLPDLDPMPWVEALPELFGDAQLDEPLDDGLWNAAVVRTALNQLLRADASHGYWRLKSLAGVTGGVLREVHLEGFDSAGVLERRVFADRLTIVAEERGVRLVLEGGAVARGDERRSSTRATASTCRARCTRIGVPPDCPGSRSRLRRARRTRRLRRIDAPTLGRGVARQPR
jgi:hypothetical protein